MKIKFQLKKVHNFNHNPFKPLLVSYNELGLESGEISF